MFTQSCSHTLQNNNICVCFFLINFVSYISTPLGHGYPPPPSLPTPHTNTHTQDNWFVYLLLQDFIHVFYSFDVLCLVKITDFVYLLLQDFIHVFYSFDVLCLVKITDLFIYCYKTTSMYFTVLMYCV